MKKSHFINSAILFVELIGVLLILRTIVFSIKPIILEEWTRPKNYLYFTIYALSIVVITYVVRKVNGKWKLKDLGFGFCTGIWKDIAFGVTLYAIIFLLNMPFNISVLPTHATYMAGEDYIINSSLFMAFLIVTKNFSTMGFFTGALHEELLYRGYLQGVFSKLTVPAIGFFVSFIPFSFGHYYSHPEWSISQVLNTMIPGLIFCLGYYATRSIIVPIVAHSLTNLVPMYPALLYAKGMTTESYICYAILGFLAMMLLYVNRSSLVFLWQETKEIFRKSGGVLSIFGVILGVIIMCLKPSLYNYVLESKSTSAISISLIVGLFLVFCSTLFFVGLKNMTKND